MSQPPRPRGGPGAAAHPGPRILLIGGSYRALYVLERLLERGERVVAFLGEDGFGERDFCPEILELCDRAGIPARSARKLGEEIARWLEDRIRPDLALRVGLRRELPLAVAGGCRMGLLEVQTSETGARPELVLRHQGRELVRRELDGAKDDERASQLFVRVTEEILALLEQQLDQLGRAHARPQLRVPYAGAAPLAGPPLTGMQSPEPLRELAARLGAGGVRLVASAQHLAAELCDAFGIGQGHEIVVPALASPELVAGLARSGARPVFCDVEPGSLTLDPRALRAQLRPATRALLVSHAFGFAARLAELAQLAQERGLVLIEDAGAALGARSELGPLGGGGHPCVFELAALGAPQGAVLLSWPAGSRAADCGPALGAEHDAAALARAALAECGAGAELRRQHAAHYSGELRRYDAFALPHAALAQPPTAACYPLCITPAARTSPDDLCALLREAGVGSRRLAPTAGPRALCDTPRAAEACERTLLLPLYAGLTPELRGFVLDALFDYAVG